MERRLKKRKAEETTFHILVYSADLSHSTSETVNNYPNLNLTTCSDIQLLLKARLQASFQCCKSSKWNLKVVFTVLLHCSFITFITPPLSLCASFPSISFPTPVSLGFTFEMCPNFKWKQIKVSSLSQPRCFRLQWPARRRFYDWAGPLPYSTLCCVPGGARRLQAGFSLLPSASVLLFSQLERKKGRIEDGRVCKS